MTKHVYFTLPHRVHVDSTTPHRLHVEHIKRTGLHMNSAWTPHGIHMESTWSLCGVQAVLAIFKVQAKKSLQVHFPTVVLFYLLIYSLFPGHIYMYIFCTCSYTRFEGKIHNK